MRSIRCVLAFACLWFAVGCGGKDETKPDRPPDKKEPVVIVIDMSKVDDMAPLLPKVPYTLMIEGDPRTYGCDGMNCGTCGSEPETDPRAGCPVTGPGKKNDPIVKLVPKPGHTEPVEGCDCATCSDPAAMCQPKCRGVCAGNN